MTTPTITDELLIKLAGEPTFKRGRAYFHDGQVLDVRMQGKKIIADVEGSEIYRVTLVQRGKTGLEGSCDCPASEGFEFCKHCVAVALAWQVQAQDQLALDDGNSADRLPAYLKTLGREQLTESLLELIGNDRHAQQQWLIRADVALGRMDDKAIKKCITSALPLNRHLHHYPQVRQYFAQMGTVVDLLGTQQKTLPADKLLALVDYALQRLNQALGTIDDSGGFRLSAMGQLHDLQRQALTRLLAGKSPAWSKVDLVQYLLAIEGGESLDMYPSIPEAYQALLGDEGRKLLLAKYQAQWDALPALTEKKSWAIERDYSHLGSRLRSALESRGDWRGVIALLQKTATETHEYLNICDLCMKHKDWGQAQTWLNKAAKKSGTKGSFHGFHDYRLERTQQKMYLHQGNTGEALTLQWKIFQGTLALADYRQLLALASKEKCNADYDHRARQFLKQGMNQKNNLMMSHYSNALVEILLDKKLVDDAAAVVQAHRVNASLTAITARALQAQPVKALPIYRRLVEQHVDLKHNDGYQKAVAILKEYEGTLHNAAHRQLFEQMLAELRVQYRPKRNFMTWLAEAFPTSS